MKTAYKAWQARQQERERQDRGQEVPPALKKAFSDMLSDSKPAQPKPQEQEKTRRWTPNNGGPGL